MCNVDYSIRVLKQQEDFLQDKMKEIEEGKYGKFPNENVNRVKTDIKHKLGDLAFDIEVLETHLD